MSVIPIVPLAAAHPQAGQCQACDVRGSSLFSALDDEALARIHADIASPSLQADERLYARGDKGQFVYTVRSGLLRFERVTERGDRRILRLAGRGDLIGQEALLGLSYGDDVIACTSLSLCRIPCSLIQSLGEQQPDLLVELMERWQHALDDSQNWVTDLATGPARRRVLRLLLRLSRHIDADGLVWLPRREEIGAMLDMTVETASRLVSQLRRDGVLELQSARVTRIDAEALQQALREQDLM